jgi:NhaA family Na+:H+ antiporter
MSLFIAGQAFPSATDFSAAKIAVFVGSILSAVVGTALLWEASRPELIEEAPQSASTQVSLPADVSAGP